MSTHVMYVIPMANGPVRLIIGGACLIFVLAILGSWTPRVIRWLFSRPRDTRPGAAVLVALAVLPVMVGLAPLVLLITLIRNPTAYVSDTGVVKDAIFSTTPIRLAWTEVAHVSCGSGRGAGPRWFTLVAADGRKIGLGNPGGIDFTALHVFLEDRLGLAVMDGCTKAVRKSPLAPAVNIEQPGNDSVPSP